MKTLQLTEAEAAFLLPRLADDWSRRAINAISLPLTDPKRRRHDGEAATLRRILSKLAPERTFPPVVYQHCLGRDRRWCDSVASRYRRVIAAVYLAQGPVPFNVYRWRPDDPAEIPANQRGETRLVGSGILATTPADAVAIWRGENGIGSGEPHQPWARLASEGSPI